MTQLPKIVFFGSGPVASATLEGLLPYFDIEAIITKPRAEGHRGDVPVLELAQVKNIPVFTPRTKNGLTALFSETHFTAPVGLVVDYGIIISRNVIDYFKKGIVNSHFSLLPEWRGADPITFSILAGRPETAGVSLMAINEKLDEGELIAQEPFNLPHDITTPKLTEELVKLSNKMLITHLPKYIAGDIATYPQPNTPPTYSRKLTKEDSILDTTKPAAQLEREIRAFAGWPKSKMSLFGHQVVVKKARVAKDVTDGTLVLPCGEHTFLEIIELTAPSGRTVSGADFLRGYKK
jgi:methionyl-tRNA formyltransferase